jgi:hypothetical protein
MWALRKYGGLEPMRPEPDRLTPWNGLQTDRGKKGALSRLPSLRTGLVDLPHPALRSMVYRQAGQTADA